ncbi:SMC-Scp complex subunit ScpB [Micropruina sp.]|uniref:SMC-Scp complex subunit ScpB n=1 Tax=Micropruina sp. TaxID=2737536 RepID=UPI0039E462E1
MTDVVEPMLPSLDAPETGELLGNDAPDPAAIAAPLEALLLMATQPMPTAELAQAVRAPVPVVEQALAELAGFYDETGRGFELRYIGGGWRYWTRAEHAELIGSWLIEGQHAKLSQAALETLAVVAYLQPISRSRVSAVRGVNVDGVLRTLVTRDLVHEVGRDPESGAMLFGTTAEFLQRLGLAGLDDLPPIAPHLPDAAELDAELHAAVLVETSSVEPVETQSASVEPVETSSVLVEPVETSSVLVELVETSSALVELVETQVSTSSTGGGVSTSSTGGGVSTSSTGGGVSTSSTGGEASTNATSEGER